MRKFQPRRAFLKHLSLGTLALGMSPAWSCTSSEPSSTEKNQSEIPTTMAPFFKISLAQWSLHKALQAKEIDPMDFASIAKNQFDIEAIEYVNQFYEGKAEDSAYLSDLKKRASDHGVTSLLIMVDNEGDLGDLKEKKRIKSVENHYKWVDAAAFLGCHSIRVNAFGEGGRKEVQAAMVDGLGRLSTYAQQSNINVLVENHGLYSSDAGWVSEVMAQVNMDNCGTLPDFGNFCTGRKWGSSFDGKCPEEYDRYQGVKEMMVYAKQGVSAKAYRFDDKGNESFIDYRKMLTIVKESGFSGYIGIEYEGSDMSESEGIMATKNLLIRIGSELNARG